MRKKLGWLGIYVLVAMSVFLITSWLLPKLEEARRQATPRIRVSPPTEHESHPLNRADLDRG